MFTLKIRNIFSTKLRCKARIMITWVHFLFQMKKLHYNNRTYNDTYDYLWLWQNYSMGCSRKKKCPPPIEEIGFPDFFFGKIWSWISRFFEQKSLFSLRFPIKFHTGTQKSTLICFLTLDFQENFVEFQNFLYVALTSSMGGGQNLCYFCYNIFHVLPL